MTADEFEEATVSAWALTDARGRRQFLEGIAAAFDCLTETSALGCVREELARRIDAERAREATEILRRAGVLGGHGCGEGGGEA